MLGLVSSTMLSAITFISFLGECKERNKTKGKGIGGYFEGDR
jgi:hypothetical protein